MAETANIAKIAELVSKELFQEFLWERSGPSNTNWPCEDIDFHKVKTHPSDVVFYYDNPYRLSRSYVNCDLKSYAKSTIKKRNVGAAIESLARSLHCAEKSIEWQKIFVHKHVNAELCGLLFVYNHDGEYDKSFRALLAEVKLKSFDIPRGSKLVVFGPDDIFWLNNVRYELVHMRGKDELPAHNYCRFYYPHLVRHKNVQIEQARAATLEMLTAPWIVLSYLNPKRSLQKEFVIFYRRPGESAREFLYLIDYLMHYQVLVDSTRVRIKTLEAPALASASFQKAVGQYLDECEHSEEIKIRLDTIEYEVMTRVITRFSEIEIGME